MKILLTTLNSKYIHSNLAIKYLYTSCSEELRSIIEVREFTINNTDDMIFIELARGDYDVIAFSCYIWNIEKTLRIAEQVKTAKSAAGSVPPKIILGGPEVSFDAVNIMHKNKFIDFILSGEGEKTFPSLLDEIIGEGDAPTTAGVTYRCAGEIIQNPSAEPSAFSEVLFPYTFMPPQRDKVVYYESSRGCPFRCAYCLSSVMKNVRALPVERVKKELDYFLEQGVNQVKFIDRTFNFDRDRCFELISYIMEHDNGSINFHFEMCGDLIDARLIELLKGARKGLFQFEIGVQSTDSQVLGACNRHTEFSRMAEPVREIIKMGSIHVHLDLIAGLPLETYGKFRNSFNEVFALRPDALQLGFLKLLKGSPIREHAAEHGYAFRSTPPYEVIANNYMSAEELVRIKMIDTVFDLWYNRGGFSATLEYLMSRGVAGGVGGSTAFDVFEALADFYYEQGFQDRNHKKEDLYRIMLRFAGEDAKPFLEQDMDETLNFDAVKKFKKKGWGIA